MCGQQWLFAVHAGKSFWYKFSLVTGPLSKFFGAVKVKGSSSVCWAWSSSAGNNPHAKVAHSGAGCPNPFSAHEPFALPTGVRWMLPAEEALLWSRLTENKQWDSVCSQGDSSCHQPVSTAPTVYSESSLSVRSMHTELALRLLKIDDSDGRKKKRNTNVFNFGEKKSRWLYF